MALRDKPTKLNLVAGDEPQQDPAAPPIDAHSRRQRRARTPAAQAPDDGPAYAPGQVIASKYRLSSVLGEGGMGSVWLARNLVLDIDVAVKLIRRDMSSAHAAERLLQEARAAARLEHPSIVRVFDFGESDKRDPFIVMEVVRGESVADLLERKGRLDAKTAVQTVLPIASALAVAHARGIIHRDLKPENIILMAESHAVVPKLVDFGIAKMPRKGKSEKKLTAAGTVLGSPDYMSPEQTRGAQDVDERTDVWALSVVLYEAIAGPRPFEGDTFGMLVTAVLTEEPQPTTDFGAGDEELWKIIRRGLEKDVQARWPSMRAMGQALAQWALDRDVDVDVAGNSLKLHWFSEGHLLQSVPPGGAARDSAAAWDAAAAQESAAGTPAPQLAPAATDPAAAPAPVSESPTAGEPGRGTWPLAVGALVLVLAVGLVAAITFLLESNDQPSTGTTATSTAHPPAGATYAPVGPAEPAVPASTALASETSPIDGAPGKVGSAPTTGAEPDKPKPPHAPPKARTVPVDPGF